MLTLFKFKYPKIAILIATILLAYFIFHNPATQDFVQHLDSFSYLGIFFAGLLFSFGFTTPLAGGFFLTVQPQNIFVAAIVGGFGALLADLTIFKIIRFSFIDEFNQIKKSQFAKGFQNIMEKSLPQKIKLYLFYAIAGIIIASPLPDEVGVTMLAGITKINIQTLALISFACNTLGILLILLI